MQDFESAPVPPWILMQSAALSIPPNWTSVQGLDLVALASVQMEDPVQPDQSVQESHSMQQ